MTIDVHEKWHVQATGNMTLALLSPSNERILVVDMLARQTIRAGDGGLRLAKTYNDLSLLSRIPDLLVGADTQHRGIPRPDAGTSPLPWSVVSDLERRRLCVKDRNGRVIADRTFPASEPVARVASLFAMVHDGVEVLNTTTVLSSCCGSFITRVASGRVVKRRTPKLSSWSMWCSVRREAKR